MRDVRAVGGKLKALLIPLDRNVSESLFLVLILQLSGNVDENSRERLTDAVISSNIKHEQNNNCINNFVYRVHSDM